MPGETFQLAQKPCGDLEKNGARKTKFDRNNTLTDAKTHPFDGLEADLGAEDPARLSDPVMQ